VSGQAVELQHEIEQFLYREARLLDEQRFEEWLGLFTEDTRYWIPIRETAADLPAGVPSDDAIAVAHIDDDRAHLKMRVDRLGTRLAHAEIPPSRTRRLIANVEITEGTGDELTVASNFIVYQARKERSEFLIVGKREDRLRRGGSGWLIARRKVVLEQTVLPRSLSVFL
jgi:dibenzofuran dioxygenase beta subunit